MENNEQKVTIKREHYNEMMAELHFLRCLKSCGLEKWENYQDALEMFKEEVELFEDDSPEEKWEVDKQKFDTNFTLLTQDEKFELEQEYRSIHNVPENFDVSTADLVDFFYNE